MKVQTTKGFIDHSELDVRDIVETMENVRKTTTQWRYKGELVRQDVNVNVLAGLTLSGEQASI